MITNKYRLEFILNTYSAQAEAIKNALLEFTDSLEVNLTEPGTDSINSFKINIVAEEPTVIFDICSQFGKIKSIKVEEGCQQ